MYTMLMVDPGKRTSMSMDDDDLLEIPDFLRRSYHETAAPRGAYGKSIMQMEMEAERERLRRLEHECLTGLGWPDEAITSLSRSDYLKVTQRGVTYSSWTAKREARRLAAEEEREVREYKRSLKRHSKGDQEMPRSRKTTTARRVITPRPANDGPTKLRMSRARKTGKGAAVNPSTICGRLLREILDNDHTLASVTKAAKIERTARETPEQVARNRVFHSLRADYGVVVEENNDGKLKATLPSGFNRNTIFAAKVEEKEKKVA